MFKKDWKKNLLRYKQLADQNLGRAEKSEVLSEDLIHLEKRVDLIKQACSVTHKKLTVQTTGSEDRKKKKGADSALGTAMLESASSLGADTLFGNMFRLSGEATAQQSREQLTYEQDLDMNVLYPLQNILENEIPSIQKLRKQLTKLTLDMDAAKARYTSAVKQSHSGGSAQQNHIKIDAIKEEKEDAQTRMEQCRDQLTTELYGFIAKEPEQCKLLLNLMMAQADYHRKALEMLDSTVPQMQELLESSTQTPLFGCSLEDHLRRYNRDISIVIEECVVTLLSCAMQEEGLFRIAGSASKVKKLKAAFDSGMVDMAEYENDVHAISSVLKHYIRELPEPLLTHGLYDKWMHAVQQPADQKLQALWVVLNQLPKSHYDNVRYLIKFCALLAKNQDINKMSPSNIAIVLGPNFIWPSGDAGPSVYSTSMQSAIVEQLITHCDDYFFTDDIDFHATGSAASASPVPPIDNLDSGGGGGSVTAHKPASGEAAVIYDNHINMATDSHHHHNTTTTPYPSQPAQLSSDSTSTMTSSHPAATNTATTTTTTTTTTSLLQPAYQHDSTLPPSTSPKVPRRVTKKTAAPLPPEVENTNPLPIAPAQAAPAHSAPPPTQSSHMPGSSSTLPKPAKPGKPDKLRSSIERPTCQPPAVPDKPSSAHHERAPSTGERPHHERAPSSSDRSALGPPPQVPDKPSVPAKPQHDRKASGSSSAGSSGTPPVFPEVPRSPRMRPPERPPLPPGNSTDSLDRGGSLERGAKPEVPPHPSQVAIDRHARAGSGKPPRPQQLPQHDRKKSGSNSGNDGQSSGTANRHDSVPYADSTTTDNTLHEENTYL